MQRPQEIQHVKHPNIHKVNHCIRVIKESAGYTENIGVPNSARMMLQLSDWTKERAIISGVATPETGAFLGCLWFSMLILDNWDRNA